MNGEYGRARGKLPPEIDGLLTSQLAHCISEARLGIEDEQIARRYYLDRICQIDIATEINRERSTVSRRLAYNISPRIKAAAEKLTQ